MNVELNETVIVDQSLPTDIIEALQTRKLCRGGEYMTAKQALAQHMNNIAGLYDNLKESESAVAKEFDLLRKGQAYFEQGYRLRATGRQMRGLPFEVPEQALAWRLTTAGWVAMSEQVCVQFVAK